MRVLLASVALLAATAAFAAPRFTHDAPLEANEGYVTLGWTGDAAAYELERSRTGEFTDALRVHRGPETSYFASGLADGTTWFRVRGVGNDGVPGAWSEPVRVEVTFPSAGRVRLLLAIGGVVFLATVAAILVGHRNAR